MLTKFFVRPNLNLTIFLVTNDEKYFQANCVLGFSNRVPGFPNGVPGFPVRYPISQKRVTSYLHLAR